MEVIITPNGTQLSDANGTSLQSGVKALQEVGLAAMSTCSSKGSCASAAYFFSSVAPNYHPAVAHSKPMPSKAASTASQAFGSTSTCSHCLFHLPPAASSKEKTNYFVESARYCAHSMVASTPSELTGLLQFFAHLNCRKGQKHSNYSALKILAHSIFSLQVCAVTQSLPSQ